VETEEAVERAGENSRNGPKRTSQLNSGQLAVLQQLAADSKPSVMCAYGENDRIEVASSGKLLDLNPAFPTLLHLLGMSEHGTSR